MDGCMRPYFDSDPAPQSPPQRRGPSSRRRLLIRPPQVPTGQRRPNDAAFTPPSKLLEKPKHNPKLSRHEPPATYIENLQPVAQDPTLLVHMTGDAATDRCAPRATSRHPVLVTMAQVKRPMPRIFLIRHGETEWSLNGRHTGRTDIPLTERGVGLIKDRAQHAVGPGKLLDPDNMCHVFISPRQRAHRTFHLLFDVYPEPPPHTVTEEVREWDYGDYEGLTSKQIHETNPGWDIFKDGCPGGESVEEMTKRVDSLITRVREIHRLYLEEGKGRRDVLICSHGHFSRVLVSRWVGFDLCLGTHFNIEPAGISMLGYNHNNLKEPSLTGLNFSEPNTDVSFPHVSTDIPILDRHSYHKNQAHPSHRLVVMSAKRPTPRLFLIRHSAILRIGAGQTGRTDIPLTDRGIAQVQSRAGKAVGPGKLIDPANVEHAFVSPRQRASKTFELLFSETPGGAPSHELTEECREWDYGEYEGLKPAEIQTVKPGCLIWRDGCPGGESPEEMTARVDRVIERVRDIHRRYFEDGVGKRDVIIVAHGHFSRVFITRWLRLDLMLGKLTPIIINVEK
ncbi:Phosphoglycerate mutase [Ceratobasidium theobromae]|uniref:Phosphoglycerate mutase n=1 Tax=Ceratobasidium theobromae TaxID=1582974 RepID=A0A5N5QPT3_9AGAM|nr:Phosphoglycerate mutase [Ceratobasidium theobromae]